MLLLIDCKDRIAHDIQIVALQNGIKSENPNGKGFTLHLDYGEIGKWVWQLSKLSYKMKIL